MSEFSNMQDRRKHVRSDVSFEVEIQHLHNGVFEKVTLCDLSSSGMRFFVDDTTQYHLKLEFHVVIPQAVSSGEVIMQRMHGIVLSINKPTTDDPRPSIGVSLRQLS